MEREMQQGGGDEEGGFLTGNKGLGVSGVPVKRSHNHKRSDLKGRSHSHSQLSRVRRVERFACPRLSVAFFTGIAVVAVFFFFANTFVLQTTILDPSSMLSRFRSDRNMIVDEPSRRPSLTERFLVGKDLKFHPVRLQRKFAKKLWLDSLWKDAGTGLRQPQIAIVLGGREADSLLLKLLTVANGLKFLGYKLTIYAPEEDDLHDAWEKVGCQVSVLDFDGSHLVDWSNFDGIFLSSLETKAVASSLMQEPFSFIPLVWIIEEDSLGRRLTLYEQEGLQQLVIEWRNTFNRADVIVFPDFHFPLLYNKLDSGKFMVISESPLNVLAAEAYLKSHSKEHIRAENGYHETDVIVNIIGSSLFYNGLPLNYKQVMHAITPLLIKMSRTDNLERPIKFLFFSGNSSGAAHGAFQEVASSLGFPDDYIRHYGMDVDINGVLLMSDVVLYVSFQDEQEFSPLLIRAMVFKIPIIFPDLSVIRQYVMDGVHGLLYDADHPETLIQTFLNLVPNGNLSELSHRIGFSGKLLAENMLASKCIRGYAKLLQNVIQFSSDTLLPKPVHLLGHEQRWEWDAFSNKASLLEHGHFNYILDVVHALEKEWRDHADLSNSSGNDTHLKFDMPNQLDWLHLANMETSEESDRLEMEELAERMEKVTGTWEDVHQNVRKADKLKSEMNERDEGELERIGQPLCIYEIYSGPGIWSILRHGSLYRGLTLSSKARRMASDDVDAADRLPLLNNTYYRDLLCETGGMFSIANCVDNIHKIPWIGFQSWRANGRKVSLSAAAERVLENCIITGPKGDVIYFWGRIDTENDGRDANLDFWSLCDILNGGQCRNLFENAFRHMYGLPPTMAALPPMPRDGGYWSVLHSWAMPTPSFLEFIMFSRMFVSSLDVQNEGPGGNWTCLLGSSNEERKNCYCRVLELLVNVWAYHSARKMVYINPESGKLEEQHPFEQREGQMWAKYFNSTLLKAMDEDLAEEADDSDHPGARWLWPLTGEVHWQGIYDREREERYRQKMDKKRKMKEKLLERHKHGYKQKSLG